MECCWLITCEHGGNHVPPEYASIFASAVARGALETHRGYDPGTWELSARMAERLDSSRFASRTTRLLVDLNRSPHHRRLFSEFTRPLDRAARLQLLERHYWPHRSAIEQWVKTALGGRGGNRKRGGNRGPRRVIHLAIHSFTPVLDGRPRRTDIGLLYDPARRHEPAFASSWLAALARRRSDLCLRRNHPYLGKADGLTTHLRRIAGEEQYVGIELEVNQRWPLGDQGAWRRLQIDLLAALEEMDD